MFDVHPFEYKLIKRVSQDFIFLQFLYICNNHPLKEKHNSAGLITFPYLTLLDLEYAHIDYVELFLSKKTANLPSLLHLATTYISLAAITNNFLEDVKHFNSQTVKSIRFLEPFVRSKKFHHYFPLL